MRYRIPDVASINRMLGMMAGPEAKVNPLDSFDESALTHQATFVDPDGTLVALCGVDMSAAVGMGCSLSMIPQAGMESMLEDNALSDSANSNLYEVMNMLSGLFMDDHTSHLKLDKVITADFQSLDENEKNVVQYTLCLGKYGQGQLRFQSI